MSVLCDRLGYVYSSLQFTTVWSRTGPNPSSEQDNNMISTGCLHSFVRVIGDVPIILHAPQEIERLVCFLAVAEMCLVHDRLLVIFTSKNLKVPLGQQ